MTSKSEKDRAKQIQDRCQNILLQMLKDEDNKYCVDCDAKGRLFFLLGIISIHIRIGVNVASNRYPLGILNVLTDSINW